MATSALKPALRQTVLLDRAAKRPGRFAALRPEVASTASAVRRFVARADKDTLWVSYERDLTQALVKSACGPSRRLGDAVLVHTLSASLIAPLNGLFGRIAFAAPTGFLPPDELAEALQAENASDLFIAGSVDSDSQTVTLWRGDLEPLTVSFSAFSVSGDGTAPDFEKLAVTDFGQTIRLGNYQAAADALLYEIDSDYRRRISKQRRESERSFGASLRRLRKQQGLRREDFEPEIAAKTVARIEQGKVETIRKKTVESIARRLKVRPEEIETY